MAKRTQRTDDTPEHVLAHSTASNKRLAWVNPSCSHAVWQAAGFDQLWCLGPGVDGFGCRGEATQEDHLDAKIKSIVGKAYDVRLDTDNDFDIEILSPEIPLADGARAETVWVPRKKLCWLCNTCLPHPFDSCLAVYPRAMVIRLLSLIALGRALPTDIYNLLGHQLTSLDRLIKMLASSYPGGVAAFNAARDTASTAADIALSRHMQAFDSVQGYQCCFSAPPGPRCFPYPLPLKGHCHCLAHPLKSLADFGDDADHPDRDVHLWTSSKPPVLFSSAEMLDEYYRAQQAGRVMDCAGCGQQLPLATMREVEVVAGSWTSNAGETVKKRKVELPAPVFISTGGLTCPDVFIKTSDVEPIKMTFLANMDAQMNKEKYTDKAGNIMPSEDRAGRKKMMPHEVQHSRQLTFRDGTPIFCTSCGTPDPNRRPPSRTCSCDPDLKLKGQTHELRRLTSFDGHDCLCVAGPTGRLTFGYNVLAPLLEKYKRDGGLTDVRCKRCNNAIVEDSDIFISPCAAEYRLHQSGMSTKPSRFYVGCPDAVVGTPQVTIVPRGKDAEDAGDAEDTFEISSLCADPSFFCPKCVTGMEPLLPPPPQAFSTQPLQIYPRFRDNEDLDQRISSYNNKIPRDDETRWVWLRDKLSQQNCSLLLPAIARAVSDIHHLRTTQGQPVADLGALLRRVGVGDGRSTGSGDVPRVLINMAVSFTKKTDVCVYFTEFLSAVRCATFSPPPPRTEILDALSIEKQEEHLVVCTTALAYFALPEFVGQSSTRGGDTSRQNIDAFSRTALCYDLTFFTPAAEPQFSV